MDKRGGSFCKSGKGGEAVSGCVDVWMSGLCERMNKKKETGLSVYII